MGTCCQSYLSSARHILRFTQIWDLRLDQVYVFTERPTSHTVPALFLLTKTFVTLHFSLRSYLRLSPVARQ